MAKLTLDAARTAILQSVYTDIEDAFYYGIEADGTDPLLDLEPTQGYDDDETMTSPEKTAAELRLLLRQTVIRQLAPLLNRLPILPQGITNSAPSVTTASATFVDLTGASFDFVQVIPDQYIHVQFSCTSYVDVGGRVEFRLVYDGVPSPDVYAFYHNNANVQSSQCFSWLMTGAVDAGTKTCKIQWRVPSSGATTSIDSNGSFQLIAR